MMTSLGTLSIDLQIQQYSAKEDFRRAWGKFAIHLLIDEQNLILLQVEENLIDFVEWFIDNQTFICNQTFEFNNDRPREGESLAHAISRYRDVEIDDMEEFDRYFDKLDQNFNFYGRHALTVAFTGIPRVIVGCHHGQGEVSCFKKPSSDSRISATNFWRPGDWAYPFDMNLFLLDTRNVIRQFLKDLTHMDRSPATFEYSQNLLSKLANDMECLC